MKGFGKFTLFEHMAKKFGELANKTLERLLFVNNNLDGFSLVNHGLYAKLSHYAVHVAMLLCVKVTEMHRIYVILFICYRASPSLQNFMCRKATNT